MATRIQPIALALLFVASLACVPAQATDLRNQPDQGNNYYAASVGVRGELIEGEGQKVTRVRRGSLADQLGLQVGDVIVAVNNIPIDNRLAWDDAITAAYRDGGWMTMVVRDAETGEEFSHQVEIRENAFL